MRLLIGFHSIHTAVSFRHYSNSRVPTGGRNERLRPTAIFSSTFVDWLTRCSDGLTIGQLPFCRPAKQARIFWGSPEDPLLWNVDPLAPYKYCTVVPAKYIITDDRYCPYLVKRSLACLPPVA